MSRFRAPTHQAPVEMLEKGAISAKDLARGRGADDFSDLAVATRRFWSLKLKALGNQLNSDPGS